MNRASHEPSSVGNIIRWILSKSALCLAHMLLVLAGVMAGVSFLPTPYMDPPEGNQSATTTCEFAETGKLDCVADRPSPSELEHASFTTTLLTFCCVLGAVGCMAVAEWLDPRRRVNAEQVKELQKALSDATRVDAVQQQVIADLLLEVRAELKVVRRPWWWRRRAR